MKTLHGALQNGHMKPFNSSSFYQPVIFTLWLSGKTTNLILRTVLTQIRISSIFLDFFKSNSGGYRSWKRSSSKITNELGQPKSKRSNMDRPLVKLPKANGLKKKMKQLKNIPSLSPHYWSILKRHKPRTFSGPPTLTPIIFYQWQAILIMNI